MTSFLWKTEKDPNSDIISLTLTYTNPLSVPMTGVMVSVSSPNDTYMRMEQADIPARTRFMTTVEVQCGDNDDVDVMIPISLDSDETQSVTVLAGQAAVIWMVQQMVVVLYYLE